MPRGLHRTYGAHQLHFITCSRYRRLPLQSTARSRDRSRRGRGICRHAGTHPPAHHRTEIGTPSTVMQVLKQRTARALLPKKKRADARQRRLFGDAVRRSFWQARFYDFNVWTTKKRVGEAAVYASQSLAILSFAMLLAGLAPAVHAQDGTTGCSLSGYKQKWSGRSPKPWRPLRTRKRRIVRRRKRAAVRRNSNSLDL
jgi:hypothetical protein